MASRRLAGSGSSEAGSARTATQATTKARVTATTSASASSTGSRSSARCSSTTSASQARSTRQRRPRTARRPACSLSAPRSICKRRSLRPCEATFGGPHRSYRALTPAGAISKVLRPLEIPVSAEQPANTHGGARIEVRGLSKEYVHSGITLQVLEGVDMSLEAGEMVAIVGASGVGQSTFLQILGTLDLPTTGSINFNGEELTRMSAQRLAEFRNRRIGFVFQFHHLLPEFSALENVMMPSLIQGINATKARTDAREILGRVGLTHRLTHRPSELSGGEQQRVALDRKS